MRVPTTTISDRVDECMDAAGSAAPSTVLRPKSATFGTCSS
jgi:hypothetical protein